MVTEPSSVGTVLNPPDDDEEETDGGALPGTADASDGIIVVPVVDELGGGVPLVVELGAGVPLVDELGVGVSLVVELGAGVSLPVIGEEEGVIILDTLIDGAADEGMAVVALPSVMDDDILGVMLGAVVAVEGSVPS